MNSYSDTQGSLDGTDLSALFGIDLDETLAASAAKSPTAVAPSRKRSRRVKTVDPLPPVVSGKVTKRAALRRERNRAVTAAGLITRGVARHMIQSWIASGVLLRTEQRGVYRTTGQTEARIAAYLAR